MTAVRFGWLGATRRKAVIEKLDRLLGDWVGAWCVRPGPADLRMQVATEWPHGGSLATVACLRSPAGQSACHLRGARHGELGRWLMDLHDEDGVGLAEAIATEALADLSRCVHTEAMGPEPFTASACDGPANPEAFRAWAGALHAQARLGRAEVDLLLDHDLCARLAPPAPPPRRALATRASAIANVKLRLHATLDFGGTNLADLSNLQVGELLVSDVPLNTPATLGVPNGEALASGQLSRAGKHLALRLHNTQE